MESAFKILILLDIWIFFFLWKGPEFQVLLFSPPLQFIRFLKRRFSSISNYLADKSTNKSALRYFLIHARIIKKESLEKSLHKELSSLLCRALEDRFYWHRHSGFFNSIQYMISLGDKDLAMRYVVHCHKLILDIDRFSKEKSIISLENEITLLELYLELAAMRKQGKLPWEIEVQPEVNLYDIAFPPMLVFPWVEFLVMRCNTGRINFRMEQDYLVVRIECSIEEVKCSIEEFKCSIEEVISLNWDFGGGFGTATKRLQLWNRQNIHPEPEIILPEDSDFRFDIKIYIRQFE